MTQPAGADGTGPPARRRNMSVFVVAAALVLSGASQGLDSGRISWPAGIASIILALALVRWPRRVRWLVVAWAAAGPCAFFLVALWYFLTLPLYPLLAWGGLAFAAVVLLLFGEPGRRRFGLGMATLVAAALVFPFANPNIRPARSQAACEARVRAMGAKARAYAKTGPNVPTHRAELPSAPSGPELVDSFPVLEIAGHAAWFAGVELPHDEEARAQVIALWFDQHGASLKPRASLYLAVDRRRHARDLAPLLRALPRVPVLLVARAEPVGDPPRGAITFAAQLDRLDPAARTELYEDQLSRRAGSCPPLAKRLASVGEVPPGDRAEAIIASLESGLPRCGCGWVDLDALEYVVLRGFGANEPHYVAFALVRNTAGEIELPVAFGLTAQQWVTQLAQGEGGDK